MRVARVRCFTVATLALVLTLTRTARAQPFGTPDTLPPTVPIGFLVIPTTVVPTPTSLAFSPDGQRLYVSTVIGSVFLYPVIAGQLLGLPSQFLSGLTQPAGVVVASDTDGKDLVYVSAVKRTPTGCGNLAAVYDGGLVLRAKDTNGDGAADVVETVISCLPNARHNTNGMAIGPDGRLYVTNGSASDSGFDGEGGQPEVQPYSGSLLRIDPKATNLTPDPSMVAATGWRNIYDVAFVPAGHPAAVSGKILAAVPMNGPDGLAGFPASEDTLSIADLTSPSIVQHFGFPWCLYDRTNGGLDGFAQAPSRGSCNPLTPAASNGLPSSVTVVQAKPSALFGLHVSSDGLAFNPGGNFPASFDHDLFVTEFGSFQGSGVEGHKIVHVHFDADGKPATVTDFMTEILPLDLTFAADGTMWVADLAGLIFHVVALPAL
jgi:glucose/arabinose dehydrogenase